MGLGRSFALVDVAEGLRIKSGFCLNWGRVIMAVLFLIAPPWHDSLA